MDESGKASGVIYIDKTTGAEARVSARAVVLAAGSGETVRLLLNSKSALFPQGLANSSGRVGRYIMDTVGAELSGQCPLLEALPAHNEDGAGGSHAYAPWWLYGDQKAGRLGFPRGYHIEMSGGRRPPEVGTFSPLGEVAPGAFGRSLKESARRYYGSFVRFAGRGEMIPNEQSFCEIDAAVKDRWGIPVLRFHWQWSDHELKQAEHMQRTFKALVEEMGGRVIGHPPFEGSAAIRPGGRTVHEVGGTIMGDNPKTSVTNPWGQTWDVKNLFIMDGGPFCSNADKNPTLTLMALAWRSADWLLAEMRKGDV